MSRLLGLLASGEIKGTILRAYLMEAQDIEEALRYAAFLNGGTEIDEGTAGTT